MKLINVGDLDISEVTFNLLKEYLAKQFDRLKLSSLGHRIRFVRSLFRFAYERIPKFLIEEDVIHLKISCQFRRERALLEFL